MSMAFTAGLHPLAPNTYAYLVPPGGWGWSNCGLVCGHDGGGGGLLIDTQFTLGLTRRLLDTVAARVPGIRIETVALTHANGDHSWGVQLLPDADVIASAETAHGLGEEIPPAAMAAL